MRSIRTKAGLVALSLAVAACCSTSHAQVTCRLVICRLNQILMRNLRKCNFDRPIMWILTVIVGEQGFERGSRMQIDSGDCPKSPPHFLPARMLAGPEPSSLLLVGSCLASVGLRRRVRCGSQLDFVMVKL